jgi:hypothetical protein
MAWNRIRRRITRELDIAIADAREEALNALLTKAFDEFTQALGEGKVPEMESKYSSMAVTIVDDLIPERLLAEARDTSAPVG